MKGKKFYKKDEWEFEGYTICNCTEQGNYELLGTYKTKERALKVLDEIQNILIDYKNMSRVVYEMPED